MARDQLKSQIQPYMSIDLDIFIETSDVTILNNIFYRQSPFGFLLSININETSISFSINSIIDAILEDLTNSQEYYLLRLEQTRQYILLKYG